MQWYKVLLISVLLSVGLCSLLATAQERNYWEENGCHLIGYNKYVQVPGCHRVRVLINACRGYCQSYTILLNPYQMINNKLFSSGGECCSIRDTHDVIVILQCENNEQRLVTYRSAASCSCTLCSHDSPSTGNNGV